MSKANYELRESIRKALREYLRTEGCSCCEDTPAHVEALHQLGDLLSALPYSDNSGHDFDKPCRE